MAEAIRKLQLFRNDTLLTGTAYEVRGLVENAYTGGNLVLRDGEPISVRYTETGSNEVKGLYGIAYSPNGEKKILWGGSGDNVNIITHPESDEYVTLRYTYDQTTNTYVLETEANVVMLDEACGDAIEITSITAEHLYYFNTEDNTYEEVFVGDIIHGTKSDLYVYSENDDEYVVASSNVDFTGTNASWSGLADACDVKNHIRYYNVVPGDDIVTISSDTQYDTNNFAVTTFEVSISTENLPTYTIGTTTTTNGYLKTYTLFKDGSPVANSTIDIPKDFLVKSGSVIEVVEHNGQYYDATDTQYDNPLDVNAAGSYIDFVINSKTDVDPSAEEHIYIPTTSLVDVYTAGDGISISTTNEVSAHISNDNGNQIRISQTDGGLFVPAGDTIVDVNTIVSTCVGTQSEDVYYGYVNGDYVVIEKVGTDSYEYQGNEYTGPHGGPVECGHKYLVVQTSGGSIYLANNDSSADIHVETFSISTDNNNNDVLRITMNNGGTHDVAIGSIIDFVPEIPAATVTWDGPNANDTLTIGTEGILTQLAISTIEEYIDNFDCGTFTIGTI